jgi:hypothetical protein
LFSATPKRVVVDAGRVDEADVVLGERRRAAAAAASRRRPGSLPTGECTVQAKRWKKPDWMQPAANSWRTYSSASTVSCTVCVGKPYIR